MKTIDELDENERKTLNDLARHKTIVRLLADIRMDMEICRIEGWDAMEYINKLRDCLNTLGGD